MASKEEDFGLEFWNLLDSLRGCSPEEFVIALRKAGYEVGDPDTWDWKEQLDK